MFFSFAVQYCTSLDTWIFSGRGQRPMAVSRPCWGWWVSAVTAEGQGRWAENTSRGRRQHRMETRLAPRPQCLFHCPIRFYLQNLESMVKLRISWQYLQSIKPQEEELLSERGALCNYASCRARNPALLTCAGEAKTKPEASRPLSTLALCMPKRSALDSLK